VVPLATVLPYRGEHVVYLARDGRAVRRVVRLDRFLSTEVVIAEGLAPGDCVIVEGHRGVIDGALLDVKP
jgi:membrane fusion protein (multidrug efflux system)